MIAARQQTSAHRAVGAPYAPLPMQKPGRRCHECQSPLSRYNPGPCFACQLKESQRRAAASCEPTLRLLTFLSLAPRTIEDMAGYLDKPFMETRGLVFTLVGAKSVERGPMIRTDDGRSLRTWRVVPQFPDDGADC
ncbi:MAG: hypothetical protein H0W82_02275 [Actinobacteria bacterium]|nr:hypothetical protein [Actinomycetota bacterium]